MKPRSALATVGQELANIPNQDTPNYKVAAAATAVLAFDTFVSSLNCGSFSFYLNATLTLLSAGVTANQYWEGKPLNQAKAMVASTGLFGATAKTEKTAKAETLAEVRDNASERSASPALN